MADIDLQSALNMFKDGVNQLQMSRAISGANDQVQQIKASEANEQQQRAQMQQVANQLTTHMAMMGAPATTMQAVAGAIGPKQYADADAMNKDALLTGNKKLGDLAEQQQTFEGANAQAIADAKQKSDPMNSLAALKFAEAKDEFNNRQFTAFGTDLDSSKASSRTSFGKWQQVEDNGSRMKALLGNATSGAPIAPEQLKLAADSLGQMVKGSALTESDQKTLDAANLKIIAAQKAAFLTGKPVKVDLSDWAKLYTGVADAEDKNAKSNMVDDLLQKVDNHAKLHSRDGKQFAVTTAAAFNRKGINVNPEDVSKGPDGRVRIKGVSEWVDAAKKAPAQIKNTLKLANGPAGVARETAIAQLAKFGIGPNSDPQEAIKKAQTHLKTRMFDQ